MLAAEEEGTGTVHLKATQTQSLAHDLVNAFTKSRTREYGDAAIGNGHVVGFITWLFFPIGVGI